jgi:Cd2+/Zn2+-exporting ATPase
MLTGDREESARAVAAQVGIEEVHSRLLPEQKLEKLQAIRHEVGAAMFVGDGINDAPVLAGADVGAAMGSGADAALEAADAVFMTSDADAIVQAVQIARATRRIAWQNVIFALGVKALVMALGLFGMASMWAAVFADSGVAMLCVLNSVRLLYRRAPRNP